MSSLLAGLLTVLLVLLVFAIGYVIGQRRFAARVALSFGDATVALAGLSAACRQVLGTQIPAGLPQELVEPLMSLRDAASHVGDAALKTTRCLTLMGTHQGACLRGFVKGLGGHAGAMLLQLADKTTPVVAALEGLAASPDRDALIDAFKEFSAGLRHTYVAVIASGVFVI